MTSLPARRFCAMGGRCTQARFLDGSPAPLRSTNKSELCEHCEKSGLSPHNVLALDKVRIEPAPHGEEQKARAFKDGLTAQLYVQKGMFWDAVRELRERRGITVERRLPPSGDNVSGLIFPERVPEDDFFAFITHGLQTCSALNNIACLPASVRALSGTSSYPLAFCLILRYTI